MNFIDVGEEIQNSKLLFALLVALIIPVINSVDNLFNGMCRVLGLSLKTLAIFSISFHGLILLCLVALLLWIVSSGQSEGNQPKIIFSRKMFKHYGLIFTLIIIIGIAVNMYVEKNFDNKTLDLSQVRPGGLEMADIAYLTLAETVVVLIRNGVFFIIYFALVFKKIRRNVDSNW